MSATLKLLLSVESANLSVAGSSQTDTARDQVATTHDYVDPTPRTVSTSGALGSAFVQLETPVVQVERLVADFPSGTDLVLRCSGEPAEVVGTVTSPTIAGNETITMAVDGLGSVTTVLDADDTTIAKIAKRVNFFHGLQIASVDTSGGLAITGSKTGGPDAAAKGWSHGKIAITGGTGLTALGLSIGTTYGSGEDSRVSAGPFSRTFPSSALPTQIELSGSSSNARFWIAGKAT